MAQYKWQRRDKREKSRRGKQKSSGRSVFLIQEIQIKKSSIKP